MSAYPSLCARAHKLGLPRRFRDDLYVHDKATCEEIGSAPFLWMPYDNGTHLVELSAARWGVVKLQSIVGYKSKIFGRANWHHWDGSRLVRVTYSEALALAHAAELANRREILG